MKIKGLLLVSLALSLVACSNATNTDTVASTEEREKLKTMTPDERLVYKVDKAKANIDGMLEIAKKARQEELDVEETKAKVEETIKSVTGEVEATEEAVQEETK